MHVWCYADVDADADSGWVMATQIVAVIHGRVLCTSQVMGGLGHLTASCAG